MLRRGFLTSSYSERTCTPCVRFMCFIVGFFPVVMAVAAVPGIPAAMTHFIASITSGWSIVNKKLSEQRKDFNKKLSDQHKDLVLL